jgi:hypothetical protein
MEFEDESYNLNLEQIAAATDYHSSVRLLAYKLKENPYYRIGNFLMEMSGTDLTSLQEVCEEQAELGDEIYDPFENVVLLALMLASAEGVVIDEERVHTVVNIMTAMITMESLRRKGFVEVNYDKVSFGEECADEIVVKKTDVFNEYLRKLEDDE